MQRVYGKSDLIKLFRSIGIRRGMTLSVHCSLSSMGLVIGGSEAFVDSLLEVIGEEGTLLFPFQLIDRKDISMLHATFSLEDIEKFRNEMIPFDSVKTDCFGGSLIAENLRRRGAVLTGHPVMKFLVYGKERARYLSCSTDSFPFGEGSVPALLYENDAYSLLVGLGFENLTCLHLAENRSGVFPVSVESYFHEEGYWKTYLTVIAAYDGSHYRELERLCRKRKLWKPLAIPFGSIGLLPIKESVDLAQAYFIKNKLSL